MPTLPMLFGLIRILPVELFVEELPMVRVCLFVVNIFPLASRLRALLFAPDIEAVGVPPAIFVTANLALAVLTPPSKKSCVVILSKIEPLASSKGDPPLATGRIPVTSPLARLIAEEERIPFAET